MFELRWFSLLLMRRPLPTQPEPNMNVGVATTFVPGAEPIEMLERTLTALVAMDYPHETWVLDEGDDPDVRALCRRMGAHHFTRKGRAEYQQDSGRFESRSKHGNYNAWLAEVGFDRYDYIAAFDPDHVPRREFLTSVLGYFRDPGVGYVQAPQVYYNQAASFIARGAAEETYDYYSSVQMAAYGMGHPIVTGCHNAHRVTALRGIGGFQAHDADDFLCTIQYRANGWRGVYVPKRLAAGLTPVDWGGYLTQQRRWARSVLDVKFWILPKLLPRFPMRERVVWMSHGLYYLQGLGVAMETGLLAFMLATGSAPGVFTLTAVPKLLLLVGIVALCGFYRQRFFLHPRSEAGFHWRMAVLRFAKWPIVLVALFEALFRRRAPYVLTKKVREGRGGNALAVSHLIVVGLIAAAWAAGATRGVIDNSTLHVCAALVVAMSMVVLVTKLRSYPEPYDPRLTT
jgi:cellulose synthase/poly-beta-1,6-N-acetylglucosamine synthase-like glycosyltransferase